MQAFIHSSCTGSLSAPLTPQIVDSLCASYPKTKENPEPPAFPFYTYYTVDAVKHFEKDNDRHAGISLWICKEKWAALCHLNVSSGISELIAVGNGLQVLQDNDNVMVYYIICLGVIVILNPQYFKHFQQLI